MSWEREHEDPAGDESPEEALERLDELIGPAHYTCPRCDERTLNREWVASRPPVSRAELTDEALVDAAIDDALLTCPKCGHTETHKELAGYLEFERVDQSRLWLGRVSHRLVLGKHRNPTWNRRLVVSLITWMIGLGGVVWWLTDREGFDRTWSESGSPEVLLVCCAFFAVVGAWLTLRSLRQVAAGRGSRRDVGWSATSKSDPQSRGRTTNTS